MLAGLPGNTLSADPVLDLTVRFRSAGLKVIAYGDGVQQWPLRSKCLPLIAGACHLLDSASAGFAAELGEVLNQALQAFAHREQEQHEINSIMGQHGIVGRSEAMTAVFGSAVRFAELSDLPVLITGESGTGKELLARAICRMDSKRRHGPFLAVNCAAINPALMESEFFGHRRGTFTGAERDRRGLIRAAEGGVLFLDEVGELDPGLQAKLLRVLQENAVLGLGDEQEVPIDVRFIAATHRNLEQAVTEGKFRADLFHRLRMLFLHVPPLRERRSDIAPLIELLVAKYAVFNHGAPCKASPDFLEAVRLLELPGNVRQLENLVRHSVMNHQGERDLDLTDLPREVIRHLAGAIQGGPVPSESRPQQGASLQELGHEDLADLVKRILDRQGWNLNGALTECERHVFHAALSRTRGNQSQVARLLGITSRSVYNKLRKLRLSPNCNGAD